MAANLTASSSSTWRSGQQFGSASSCSWAGSSPRCVGPRAQQSLHSRFRTEARRPSPPTRRNRVGTKIPAPDERAALGRNGRTNRFRRTLTRGRPATVTGTLPTGHLPRPSQPSCWAGLLTAAQSRCWSPGGGFRRATWWCRRCRSTDRKRTQLGWCQGHRTWEWGISISSR